LSDTIFALATAPGRAAVAVVRISGPGAGGLLVALGGEPPEPRRAAVMTLRGAGGETLDQALVLWFPGPRSFTGEDVAELHLHGGAAVVDAVSGALAALGARPAEPGEFTRRAFQNGKMDLAQAEAVADLVDAESEAQRRQALAQLGGALGQRHEDWRERILDILALLEAEIDFPDEEVPEGIASTARPLIEALAEDFASALSDAARGERVRDGFRVAIVGAPNAGKSSLLNRLLGRDAAIVTEIAGTTRDVIEAPLHLAGYKVLLADTAGLRATDELVEREGVRRARAWAEAADLRLLVVDAGSEAEAWREAAESARAGDLLVLNKVDRGVAAAGEEAARWAAAEGLDVRNAVALQPDGVEDVRAALTERVVARLSGGEFPAATRLRHRALLQDALEALQRAAAALRAGPELAAAEVRLAGQALGRVTGAVDNEQVLDRVFASFCIGK
jgi:tRNA modification GTPase